VTDDFIAYARPLIGEEWASVPVINGIQRFARLKPVFAQKRLRHMSRKLTGRLKKPDLGLNGMCQRLKKLFLRVGGAIFAADTIAEWKRKLSASCPCDGLRPQIHCFYTRILCWLCCDSRQFHSYSWRLDPLSQLVPRLSSCFWYAY
jgi:hypothetical protein